jgi:hypothetical protein
MKERACQHCGKPVWQPEKHGEWYHDDSAGTLRCCEGKQVANPVASQQPAPIPEDLSLEYSTLKLLPSKAFARRRIVLIERIARLEAALRAARKVCAEGHAAHIIDAALGTPGKGEKC